MDDLVQWLRAQLDNDALWATEASREYGEAAHEGGVHWQWVEPDTDTPVVADPSRGQHLTDDAENFRFSLRSVEEFPRRHVGPLPLFAIHIAEEIPAAVAGHIAAHDPARVLREIEAKRGIIAAHERRPMPKGDTADCAHCWGAVWPCPTLRLLALPYADKPGYQESWRP